ncbi:lipocalin-like domain-containing protein [Rhodococcus sp. RS1C4]|nr:lipocalin-like domain-containing protein [Rhodococcus sp. RS1C4]
MTSLEVGTEGNLAPVPYSGQVIFTNDTMSVQAMNPDTAAPDTPLTVQGYEAYYGDLVTDVDAGTFTVTVESAAARDLIGQTFNRNYAVDGDTLILTPSDPVEGFRVTYERHSAS